MSLRYAITSMLHLFHKSYSSQVLVYKSSARCQHLIGRADPPFPDAGAWACQRQLVKKLFECILTFLGLEILQPMSMR